MVQRNLLVYKHSWMVIFSGFFEPLFYLLSIGIGIGSLVSEVNGIRPDDRCVGTERRAAATGLLERRLRHRQLLAYKSRRRRSGTQRCAYVKAFGRWPPCTVSYKQG